jgi:hypothetical protein
MKVCIQCHQTKPFNEFSVTRNSKDGYFHCCDACKAERRSTRLIGGRSRSGSIHDELNYLRENTRDLTKRCSKCKKIKRGSEFYLQRSSPDGLQTYCIPCQKAIIKASYDRRACSDLTEENLENLNEDAKSEPHEEESEGSARSESLTEDGSNEPIEDNKILEKLEILSGRIEHVEKMCNRIIKIVSRLDSSKRR